MACLLQILTMLTLIMLSQELDDEQFDPSTCPSTNTCSDSSVCQCDQYCKFFGDCCREETPSDESLFPDFSNTGPPLSSYQCRSVHVSRQTAVASGLPSEVEKAFWMVVRCPSSWQVEYIEAQCVGSGSSRQPVTDADTGIVYQNEYCAVCNGVRVDRFFYWNCNLACSTILLSLANESEFVLTQGILQQYCQPCSYVETDPLALIRDGHINQFTFAQPRACFLSKDTCLSREKLEMATHLRWSESSYSDLVSQCKNKSTTLVMAGVMSNGFRQLYKNLYCALCNGETHGTQSLSCPTSLSVAETPICVDSPGTSRDELPVNTDNEIPTNPPLEERVSSGSGLGPDFNETMTTKPPDPEVSIDGSGTFSVVLDVTQGGLVLVNSRIFNKKITVTFTNGEVFDPVIQGCRPAVTNIFDCPEGSRLLALNESDSDLVFIDNITIQYGDEIFDVTGRVDLHVLICYNNSFNDTFAVNITNCPEGTEFLELNVSDRNVVFVDNDTILYGDESYQIAGKLDTFLLICVGPNDTIGENSAVLYYEYPAGYVVLTYIVSSFSVIGCIIIIFTYSLYRDLRTLSGKILINLASAILVSNVVILLSDWGSRNQAFCTATAIILHLFFLTESSWMTILIFEIGRNLHQARKLLSTEPTKRFYSRLFNIYLLLGWLTPAVIVGATIAANYLSDDDLVLYGKQKNGRQGRCWINHVESAIVAFLFPVATSILFNAAAFVVISVWIYKAWRGQVKLKKKSQNIYYVRVYFALFTVSGICWLFGYLAILADEEWAWYPFIVLNSIQGFVLFVAFVLTKKIATKFRGSTLSSVLIKKLTGKNSASDKTIEAV